MTSSSLRIPFATTSYAKLPLRVSFVTASGIIVCPSCVHRVSIGRLRTCFGSTLAFYQIGDENRAKLRISYSCGHRVSKSARYDATLSKNKCADQLRSKNKGADQLGSSNCEADQRLCFRYTDSTIHRLSKSKISTLYPSSVTVQPGLCRTWSEPKLMVFSRTG